MAKKTVTQRDAEDLAIRIEENYDRIQNLKRSTKGKYRVIGMDKFDHEDWLEGEYTTAEKALEIARALTGKAMKYASDSSIATVYYAYAPDGKYLGGDTWENE